MSKTVISLLIWLVCMPCMAAAETSKELEDALEKAKKEVSALFDANETEAYINSNRKLMELCLEAYMSHAREVGGDLYGYLLREDKLYFAVGDVSGKGVPASLFMAQATRLFQTMAKQGMMPAEICTRMNDALSGDDNENGMFVTFWLGLVNLQTGRLDYCNAGHKAPLVLFTQDM